MKRRSYSIICISILYSREDELDLGGLRGFEGRERRMEGRKEIT